MGPKQSQKNPSKNKRNSRGRKLVTASSILFTTLLILKSMNVASVVNCTVFHLGFCVPLKMADNILLLTTMMNNIEITFIFLILGAN